MGRKSKYANQIDNAALEAHNFANRIRPCCKRDDRYPFREGSRLACASIWAIDLRPGHQPRALRRSPPKKPIDTSKPATRAGNVTPPGSHNGRGERDAPGLTMGAGNVMPPVSQLGAGNVMPPVSQLGAGNVMPPVSQWARGT